MPVAKLAAFVCENLVYFLLTKHTYTHTSRYRLLYYLLLPIVMIHFFLQHHVNKKEEEEEVSKENK